MTDRATPYSRRAFLSTVAGASVTAASGLRLPLETSARPAAERPSLSNSVAALDDNIYTRVLGIRPHLGAHEHISRLGGGRMAPEVLSAIAEANEFFVDMHELNAAAGRRAAELLGAEAAFVSAGGFSGLILGAAACLTGSDPEKIQALPHPTWVRRECLIQSAQRFDYDRAYRSAGATIVYADTRADMLARLGESTALIAGLVNVERQGVFAPPFAADRAPPPDVALVRMEGLIAMGKQAGVPVLIDMASDLPPWGSIRRLLGAGADLIVLSGGKAIGGPQATGIVAGRRDLIEAVRLNASPHDNIGRGMKVGKESVVGLIVALERFMKQDNEAEMARWNARARRVVDALQGIRGLTVSYALNTAGYRDADLRWDEADIPLDRDRLRQQLAGGAPKVELEVIVTKDQGTRTWHATARTRVLRDGEEMLVAKRLREVFQTAGT